LNRLALSIAMLLLLCPALVGCDLGSSDAGGHITVQHILIGVGKTGPTILPFKIDKPVTRTPDQAVAIAQGLLKRAKAGEDFDKLVRQYSEDVYPGIYNMSNHGVAADPGEYPRINMPQIFGTICFTLKVGDIVITPYDQNGSPEGVHVIKRLR